MLRWMVMFALQLSGLTVGFVSHRCGLDLNAVLNAIDWHAMTVLVNSTWIMLTVTMIVAVKNSFNR